MEKDLYGGDLKGIGKCFLSICFLSFDCKGLHNDMKMEYN